MKAVCNTGPILHLCEINQEQQMDLFGALLIPSQVNRELEGYGILNRFKKAIGDKLQVQEVGETELDTERNTLTGFKLHTADISVVVLAKRVNPDVVLTDDLQLRRAIESVGTVAVGSVGILIRAFKEERLTKSELATVLDRLFTGSTLYLSKGFKEYVRQLIAKL